MEDKEKTKKLLIICSNSFEDVRCDNCKALLFRALKKQTGAESVEIKCRKCGKLNRY